MFTGVAIGVALVLSVQGWNEDGHKIVAALAAYQLTSAGKRFVGDHLTGFSIKESMIKASTWADEIAAKRPDTAPLHFVNTPNRNCMPYEAARDCQYGKCIVTAIAKYSQKAIDMKSDRLGRTEAIQFLIHFLADIHQPLHVSFRMDGGGTGIHLDDPLMSLHEVWDFEIFNSFNVKYNFVEYLINELEPYVKRFATSGIEWDNHDDVEKYAADLATDTGTRLTCKVAYTDTKGGWIRNRDMLTDDYMIRGRGTVKSQLVRAAQELSRILNGLGELYIMKKYPVAVACPAPGPVNRFVALDMDFDVDDASSVESEDLPKVVPKPELPKSLVVKSGNRKKIITKSKKKNLIASSVDHTDEEALSDVSGNIVRKSKRTSKSNMFEGVNMKRVILLADDICGLFIVTTDVVKRDNKVSLSGTLVDVEFTRNPEGKKNARFFFESSAFNAPISDELITETLIALRKISANPSAIKIHSRGILDIAPMADVHVVYPDDGPEEPEGADWEEKVLAQIPQMVVVKTGRLMLVTTFECMYATHKNLGKIRAREYSVGKADSERRLLVDTAWVDGLMTPKVAEAIIKNTKVAISLSKDVIELIRPTLPYELKELETFLFEKENLPAMPHSSYPIDLVAREEADLSGRFLEWKRSPHAQSDPIRFVSSSIKNAISRRNISARTER